MTRSFLSYIATQHSRVTRLAIYYVLAICIGVGLSVEQIFAPSIPFWFWCFGLNVIAYQFAGWLTRWWAMADA
jgi:hypothetical protein